MVIFDVEPLSRAIICNEPESIVRLLELNPSLVVDMPSFGFDSHLHMALKLGRLNCFEQLLETLQMLEIPGPPPIQGSLQAPMGSRGRYQSHALPEWLVKQCVRQTRDLETDSFLSRDPQRLEASRQPCWYLGPLSLLIVNGCPMRPRYFGWWPRQTSWCPTCPEVYFTELRNRRQQVRALALQLFNPIEIRKFDLDKEILLDRHYASVIQHLQGLDVQVPIHLIDADKGAEPLPLYHGRMDRAVVLREFDHAHHQRLWWAPDPGIHTAVATHLYDAGFRDFEAPLHCGMTLLEYHTAISWMWPRQPSSWNMICWILDHSTRVADILAKPWRAKLELGIPCPIARCVACNPHDVAPLATVAHILSSALGFDMSEHIKVTLYEASGPWRPKLVQVALNSTYRDGTGCVCAPNGRTPFMYLLRGYTDRHLFNQNSSSLATAMAGFIRVCGAEWKIWHFQQAFRLLTFEALWLEHTCELTQEELEEEMSHCVRTGLSGSGSVPDELKKRLFTDIVSKMTEMVQVEFVDAFHPPAPSEKYGSGESSDKKCSVDDYDDGYPPYILSSGAQQTQLQSGPTEFRSSIWRSWLERWTELVDGALVDLNDNAPVDDLKTATEAIGVIWGPPKPNPGINFKPWRRYLPDSDQGSSLEYWAQRLDEI
ncbi:uncharacterized protein B0I36DRAFT_319524 [Microdochium trichocladiopsis]|uniref:Uncharacterized protein n=1 Tax=Microdochium trichocladiopsis TaxID=1682393 RepID=A0A9P8YDH2_9PEZI|nr:uncharacterized protein B0I36DRAFT_319524 [Microdochium trichocladiopsis]KAH7036009.1 hypothetical protein B0I36DRAFT_319524 [Microdochium trichocladiopsis]